MTIEIAALLGMGLVVLWGLVALLFAIKVAKTHHHMILARFILIKPGILPTRLTA